MLTDTHCHLDFNKFDEDRERVIQRAVETGVRRILIPALDLASSQAAIRLSHTHPAIFAAVGFHPTDLDTWTERSISQLNDFFTHTEDPTQAHPGHQRPPAPQKIVAIGEIGLDYYWVKEPEKRAIQKIALVAQLQLAQKVNKPVIIHMREEGDAWLGQASTDLLDILGKWQSELTRTRHPLADKPGVLHSFNGTLETAQTAIAHNFYIGVTGPITYKNAEEKRQIVREIPLDRLLIETDAPFLTPVPHRGKRNEPAFVAHIADKIAEIHQTTRAQVAEITSRNAMRLFGWEADF